MTLKEWERRLINNLKGLSKEEREKIRDYYREIYGDKVDAGYTGEEIVEEFGSPEECAQKILAEGKTETANATTPSVQKKWRFKKPESAASIVGMVFLNLCVLVPMFSVILAIIAAFAAVAIGGAAAAVGFGLYAIVGPIYSGANGAPFGGCLAHLGIGVAGVGIGILLFIAFYFVTKYSVIGAVKLFKRIYFRRVKQ